MIPSNDKYKNLEAFDSFHSIISILNKKKISKDKNKNHSNICRYSSEFSPIISS
jgi:hypothetical protein